MDPSQSSRAQSDVWALYKTDICHLYGSRTLPSIKAYMEKNYNFPFYSLSTWKKQIRRWRLDTKNNKKPDMVAAATHFRQCSHEDKLVPFTLPNGKKIAERELQRYMRRSKQAFLNGKLVPKGALSSEPVSIPESSGSLAWTGHHLQKLAPPMAERLAYRRLLALRRVQTAFLFGQGFVCPADPETPYPLLQHEVFLRSLERCLRCSWELEMWSVDQYGELTRSSSAAHGDHRLEFYDLLWMAGSFHDHRDIHQARKILFKAFSALRISLTACLPFAVQNLLVTFKQMLKLKSSEYTKIAMKWASDLVAVSDDTYPGIESLFVAFGNMNIEALPHLLTEAWQVWSRCFRDFSDRLCYLPTFGDIQRIYNDQTLGWKERGDALASLQRNLQIKPKASSADVLRCVESLDVCRWECSEFQKAEDAAEKGLCTTDACQHAGTDSWQEATANSLRERAHASWKIGDKEAAIDDLEAAIDMLLEYSAVEVADIEQLTFWQQEREGSQVATAYRRMQAYMIDNISTVSSGDACFNEDIQMRGSFKIEDSDRLSRASGCEDNFGTNALVDIGRTWQRYISGEPAIDEKAESYRSEWRKAVEPAVQECLVLTEDDSHDDELP